MNTILKLEVPQADEAFALDWYKDNNEYTDIGWAVHNIKYVYIKNGTLSENCFEIKYLVKQLMPFVSDCDVILPIPSFNPKHEHNPSGELKTMYEIATCLKKVSGRKVDFSILEKVSSNQAKDSQLSADDYISNILPSHIKKVLLIDDLFGEGNTAKYTVAALKQKNPNIWVRFVSLTKNKYGGIHKRYDCRISKFDDCYHISDKGKESLNLYFYRGDKGDKVECVKIWSTHSQFQDVKQAFDSKDFKKIFKFLIYKNEKGYWQIVDDR
ncbi:phosphoribosyltransferase [Streptococcus equinus]|uniref:phosphoribosyltransferase n=1 Tax=Streptococcus equinus TaxID=1335 RepID=UPI0008804B69|nr:phosphoribosyltransferase [Streptococcus equinus]SDQ68663.1 hypothetical protein SAMN05216407_1835 [Streptococcus equinus]